MREIRTLRANGRGLETEMTDGSSGTLTRKGRNSQGSQDLSIHRASSRPYRFASPPASRRRPRGSSAGGSARRSRCRVHARATSPRRSLRTATRRWASSRSTSSSSWSAATSPSPQLSPARAGPPPRAAASAARAEAIAIARARRSRTCGGRGRAVEGLPDHGRVDAVRPRAPGHRGRRGRNSRVTVASVLGFVRNLADKI